MRLYAGKISPIASEILQSLLSGDQIELSDRNEAQLDIEAVLKEFLRREREVMDVAKQRMADERLGYGNLGRVRARVSKELGFPEPDETLPYLVEQLLEMLFHSTHVEEIFAEDVALRKLITSVLRKHMDVETNLDREVRAKIKNLEEGTSNFEVEYAKIMDEIKRAKGLE